MEEVLLKGRALEKDNRFIGKEKKYIASRLYFQLLALTERRKMECKFQKPGTMEPVLMQVWGTDAIQGK